MHLTKPVLVAASFLWVTAFASPINSPAILRARGLIGGSTTDGNTKDIAGSTAAGNPVGDDNTKSISKSNAVEGAIDSFHLDDFAGSLTARDVSKRGHRRSMGPGSSSASGPSGVSDSPSASGSSSVVTDAVCVASDTTQNDSAKDTNDANEANDAKSDSGTLGDLMRRGIVGANAEGLTARDVSKRGHSHSTHGHNIAQNIAGGGDHGGVLGVDKGNTHFVARDNDGTVHDANKAVHDANKIVHNTLHGLLHGILL
ncbi:hypothetical protein ACHAO1_007096 [Botrytis cinerea]